MSYSKKYTLAERLKALRDRDNQARENETMPDLCPAAENEDDAQ